MFTGKKVLFLTTTDNMIWQFLLPLIKQLEEAGNTVECACNKSGFWFEELKDKGLIMHEMNFARNPLSVKNIKGYNQLKKLVKEQKYDIIHCHQPVGGLMGRIVASKFKIPVIYTAHGFHFYKGAPLVNNLVYKTIEKWLAKKTDVLITMNEEDYQAAKKFKAKQVYKINGIGVDLTKYKKTKPDEAIKSELGVFKNVVCLVSVGELNSNKNHEVVIKALSLLKNNNYKYLVCGQGSKFDDLTKLSKRLNVDENVKFLGFRKDIEQIYNISDIFLMPSKREGLPKSQMEAMAFGLPVIASNIRGCNDLIKNKVGGFLVESSDVEGFACALELLISNKSKREEFSSQNLEQINNFSIQKVLSQMKDIYSEMEIG